MRFTTDLLAHVKAVKACAESLRFSVTVDLVNLALDIEQGDLRVRFQPRFFVVDPKRGRNYSLYFRQDALGFVGWLPYFNKVWPIALDKLAFKRYARDHGLSTPDWWTQAPPGLTDFLAKRRDGSLGVGMRGPFRRRLAEAAEQQLGENEFYERFVEGRIAKIWYWNADPVCMELLDFPRITGDGRRTLRELIQIRLGDFEARWQMYDWNVQYFGKQLDSVLADGESVVAGFRYGSLLDPRNRDNYNVLAAHLGGEVGAQLKEAGRVLWPAVPEQIRTGVVYTVDAVLDPQNRLWLLEMNPNPALHPDVYPAMLKSVLARQVSEMPSTESKEASADKPYMKGGLVWSSGKRASVPDLNGCRRER